MTKGTIYISIILILLIVAVCYDFKKSRDRDKKSFGSDFFLDSILKGSSIGQKVDQGEVDLKKEALREKKLRHKSQTFQQFAGDDPIKNIILTIIVLIALGTLVNFLKLIFSFFMFN